MHRFDRIILLHQRSFNIFFSIAITFQDKVGNIGVNPKNPAADDFAHAGPQDCSTSCKYTKNPEQKDFKITNIERILHSFIIHIICNKWVYDNIVHPYRNRPRSRSTVSNRGVIDRCRDNHRFARIVEFAHTAHTIFQRSRRCDRGGTHTGNVTVGKSRSQKLSPFELTHARHFQHQVPSCSRKGTFARTIHCDLGFLPAIHISIINGHTGQRTIQIPAHKIRDRLAHSRCLHRRCILAYHLPFVNRHTRHRHRQASATNIGFELAHSHTFDRNRRFIDPGLGKTEDIPDNENDSSGAAPTYTTTRLDISFFLLDDKAPGSHASTSSPRRTRTETASAGTFSVSTRTEAGFRSASSTT